MSTRTTMIATSSSCGCGGSCGGTCGSVTVDGGAFRRPSFFAGQLLTEEDLGALVDYVVGKNRLHNRFLFGDGVVCGLQLLCDPCDPAAIKVTPGYALDCCGNDILVSCPETLDAKALLRDLRQRQAAGYQCGDPCDAKDGKRRYGLYLTYQETPVDAVAPYASGDPCGQQQCQATRIAEGYRFELRCDCGNELDLGVFKRILACVGDIREAAVTTGRMQANQSIAGKAQDALYSIRNDASATAFAEPDAATIGSAGGVMQKLVAMRSKAQSDNILPEEQAFRWQVAEFQKATAAMARFYAQTPEAQREAQNTDRSLPGALKNAGGMLPDAAAAVQELAPRVIFDPTMAAFAEESAVLAAKYADPRTQPDYGVIEAKMMMAGAPLSAKSAASMKGDVALIKRWLLERLEGSCSISSCTLYDRVRAVAAGDPATTDDDEADRVATVRAVRELTIILIQYFVDCICLALNPVCPDCTDNSVLLGCVEIDECKVVDLCNLSRRFVLAPTSLRYWMPQIGWLGELIGKLCCEFDAAKLFKQENDPKTRRMFRAAAPMTDSYAPVLRSASMDGVSLSMLRRLDLDAKDAENVSVFAGNMALLALRFADTATQDLQPAAKMLWARFGGAGAVAKPAPASAADAAGVRGGEADDIQDIVDARIEEALAREQAATTDAINAAAAARDSDVKQAVTRELSASRIANAVERHPLVKQLKTANANLVNELNQLKAAVEALKEDK